MCRERISEVILAIVFILVLIGIAVAVGFNTDFLNKNSGAWNVFFSGVVAASTLIYALLTWKLVHETQKMREAQTEPKVAVIIEPREEWINFVDMKVMNSGLGPAYKIRFGIKPDFEHSKGNMLSATLSGIKYLAPNQKIRFFLTSLTEDYEKKSSMPFDITVTYQNSSGKNYEETFKIDFSQFKGMLQLGVPPIHKIANSMEDLQKDIRKLSTGFSRIETVIHTQKDINNEKKLLLRKYGKKLKKE